MKKFLLGVLRGPETGEAGSGGGFGALAASFFNETKSGGNSGGGGNADSGDSDNETDSDDDDAGGDDGDLDSSADDGYEGGSVIERELRRIEGSDRRKSEAREKSRAERESKKEDNQEAGKDESSQADGGQEGKAKDQKPKEWDGKSKLTDDELLNLDPKTSLGSSVSVKVNEGFKLLKTRLKELHQEVATFKSGDSSRSNEELETLRTQLTEKETKLAELQKQIDDEYFESSPGFRDTFQKPVDEAMGSLRTFFRSYVGDATKEDQAEIKNLFMKAAGFASAGNRAEYLETMDELCSGYIKGSTVIQNEFARNAAEFYSAQKNLADAMVNKGEDRKKLVESKTAERRSKETIGLESDIDRFIKTFEAENQMLINSLPKEHAGKFQSSYRDGAKATKAALAQFSATGILPSSLNDVIARGTAYEALNQKSIVVWNAFMDAVNKNKIMQEELEQTKKRLSRYSKEPNRANSSPNRNTTPSEDNGGGKSGNRLLAAYQQVLAGGRED